MPAVMTQEALDRLINMEPKDRVRSLNEATVREWSNGWRTRADEAFREEFGYSLTETVRDPKFSPGGARKKMREGLKLSEAVTTSQVYALTTGMILNTIIDAYQLVKTIYRSVASVIPSDASEEEYFALQRADIPVPLGDTEAVPESRLSGILTRIRNYRFARILVIARTAYNDDKTGKLKTRASTLGDGMAYAEERWWAYQVFSQYIAANIRGGNGSNPIVPPMNVAGQAPSGYGGPVCTAGPVYTQANVENLIEAADYVTDIKGEWTLVDPNSLVFAKADKIAVKKMFTSAYAPSTPSASAGVIGGIFSKNVLEGELDLYASQFVGKAVTSLDASTNPWALGEAGKFGVFQDREPLEVIQEVPNAGKSFEENTVRTRAERRFGAGVSTPEFVLRGN